MTEQERAEQFAQALEGTQGVQSPLPAEDQALLRLAKQLSTHSPFAPTPAEQAQLRRRFEQEKALQASPNRAAAFSRLLRPALQAVAWAALLIGVFAVVGLLLANLLGKPSNPTAGPAPTVSPQVEPTQLGRQNVIRTTPTSGRYTPQPVPLTLEQALALVHSPTWSSVFFEYQVTSYGPNRQPSSFYKQVWMDREKRGRVISSDQVEGNTPRSAAVQPSLLFISDGQRLKALHLPTGKEEEGFANATWRANPLENAGEGMADFFPPLSGFVEQVGSLKLEPLTDRIAGRETFILTSKTLAFWYDLETGLLLRKAQMGDNIQTYWLVTSVVYQAALPPELDDAGGAAQVRFVEKLPTVSTDAAPPKTGFPVQSQEVNGIRMDLREVANLGSSLTATLCYQQPDQHNHRLVGVELKVGDRVLPFLPTSGEMPGPGPDGLTCETFTGAYPGISPTGEWTLTAHRLIAPRDTLPDCDLVNQQLAVEFPGLTVTCDQPGSGSFGFSADKMPEGMDLREAQRIMETFIDNEVSSGPWRFAFNAADIVDHPTQIATGGTPIPVVVPGTCDPNLSSLADEHSGLPVGFQSDPVGLAGSGSAQSGRFKVQIGLICDPSMNRLISGSDHHSEINGLGILWKVTNQGDPVSGEIKEYSGVSPFVIASGGVGDLRQGDTVSGYQGLHFPDGIRPDFTQSDVRLRYLVKVRLPDGSFEGGALSFTLQRAVDGYRPVDVTAEPLTEAERQSAESRPDEPIPFPTLSAPVAVLPSDTRTLLALLDKWQKPLLASPGWIHLRTRTEIPGGNDLYAGLTEYINEDWFQIDAQANVTAMIHIDSRLDGTVLQQSIAQNGKSTNLTFGGTDDFKPYPLDLGYAVKDTLKSGDQVKIQYKTGLKGGPVMTATLSGMFTRRDVVDALSGAWLYTETLQVKAGEDPQTGTLESRITMEAAERVDAPPPNALALLGQSFTGYTPAAPYGTPAPQGFDPTHSMLTLNTVPGDDFNAPSFWYGDISADGYLLGRVDFGNVPGGSCVRSAGGTRLAFIYTQLNKDGSFQGNSLRWFNLRALDSVHKPAPELVNIGTLSWSPKEETLTVFGCKANQQGCGLYLLDPATDQIRLLIPNVYAEWPPIWSPEGFLAFVNTLDQSTTLYVVDIHTGQVTYQGKFDTNTWQAPTDSPTNAWGVAFPRGMVDNACYKN